MLDNDWPALGSALKCVCHGDARMNKKIRNAPSWLGLSNDRESFVYLPERAEIVRKIFELCIGGFGGVAIAQLMNKKQIPGFGSSKKWDQSTIHNMLTNRATIGEYQRKQTVNAKEEAVGDPVPNYYPAVIDPDTFAAAQIARRKNMANRSGRRGKAITNIFFGLASCRYCSQSIKFKSNGADKSLFCSTVLVGSGKCPRYAWTYNDFENVFFDTVQVAAQDPEFSQMVQVLRADYPDNVVELLEARMNMARFLRVSIKALTIAVAGAKPPPPKPHLIIRRDHPARFFEVKFFDGSSFVGSPHVPEPTGQKIPLVELEKRFDLSPRQAQITSLLVQGFSLKEAAEKLGQSLATGRWHLREIFRRTNTRSQSDLIKCAERSFHSKRASSEGA
jgi:DNA-binding CsgD family transcriptional regulator